MKQKKHFKRTAFNLSAKSMVSTLLLLIAMLMPQGVWATDFISEIKVSVHKDKGETARNKLTNDGYQIVNVDGAADLNGGGGGHYVYIGYKTSTNAADAITGLLIVESATGFDAHAIDNITNANITYNGKNYYRCANYDAGDARLDCDLNRGRTGKPDIVLFYTKDGNTTNGGTPLTSISVVGNTTTTGVSYTRHWQYGTAQNGTSDTDVYGNTNQGGTAHYITYTTHTHSYTAAFNWATNGKSCTATTNCAGCGDTHSNLACAVTSAQKTPATCTVMGWTTYTAKITSNGKEFSATTDRQDIAALGHGSAGYTDSYSWTGNAYNDASKDTKACIFTLTCKKCSTKVVNGASLTCIKTAHVDALCIATGSTTYQATGSYTAANSAYNYSAIKTNVYTIAALGHGSAGYDENYSWTGNAYNNASQDTKACIFTLTCKKCRMKVVNGASLTCIKTAHVDATCTATGSTTYMATGSYTAANSAYNYHATKTHEYPIAAIGHGSTGYTPTYTWGGTYDDATCTFTLQCGRCDGVVFNDNITTSKVDANHKDATCTEPGNERWTATGYYSKTGDATYNGTAQTKDYTIPTSHHTFTNKTLTDDPVEDGLYAYACDYGCGERNDAHVIKNYDGEGNNLELTKDGEGNYTAYSVDIVDGKSFFTPVPFTSKIVTMNRTFIVSHTSDDIVPATVMLPFSIEAEALAPPAWMDANFGCIFYEFNSIIRNPETDKWEAIMTRVPDDDVIQAYTPYILVMMNLDVNHLDFGWNYNTMTFPATPAASDMITTDAENGWTYVALNEAKTWEEGDEEIGRAYLIEENSTTDGDIGNIQVELVKIEAGTTLEPGRCYLVMNQKPAMRGDINGDGKISLADLTLLVEILNGDATDTTGVADLDGKNGVTIDDLEILRNYLLGLLNIEDLYPEDDGQTPGDPTPAGFSINYDDEDEVPTVTNHIWDR